MIKNEIHPDSLEQLANLSWEQKLKVLITNENILQESGLINAMNLKGDI